MRVQEEQIRNVSKIFEAFARAIAKSKDIKIKYLNDDGDLTDFTIEISRVVPLFSLDVDGFIKIWGGGEPVFNQNITDIQSVTIFRTTKLKFSETKKD